ncbi:MAG: DUF2058 family protein [bacterium]|nr:DUF2058 family protein [bacterium]
MNLRDQFKKAKILSDKDAKRLAHESRVERTEKGHKQIEQEQKDRQQEVQRLRQEGRELSKKQQEQLDRERKAREELAAAKVLLGEARRPARGPVKFYFATNDGALPWLELSPREAQEVTAGALCIMRTGPVGTHVYGLLGIESARRVAKQLPDTVAYSPKGVL